MCRQKREHSLKLKDNALRSIESDVESLNNRIVALSSELAKSHLLAESKIDGLQTIHLLETEKSELESKLQNAVLERDTLVHQVGELSVELEAARLRVAETTEKLAVAEVIVSQQDGVHPSKDLLESLQAIWVEIGMDLIEREKAAARIQFCLDDTCKALYEEAKTLKSAMQSEYSTLQLEIGQMQRALDTIEARSTDGHASLSQRLAETRKQFEAIQPIYQRAVERSSKLMEQAKSLQRDLEIPTTDLSNDLRTLLSLRSGSLLPDDESNPSSESDNEYRFSQGSFKETFLASCEREISSLRLRKSEILVSNLELQKAASSLAEEMHLEARDIVSMTLHVVENKMVQLPLCWSVDALDPVSVAVATCDRGLLQVSPSFTEHLKTIHDVLTKVASVRRSLSSALKDAVEQAQKSLLNTVGGELSASEAYSSFHEALFRLPQLSMEHIDACITELNALAAGVDTLTQSEIEALTIVWEALSVGSDERGKFWVEVDDLTTRDDEKSPCPFNAYEELCTNDPDKWVVDAMENARTANKTLRKRLYKLELIHGKVEQLRAKQDRKSKIISLDSEIRILNAKLDDFEEKKCSKQRLLTKKAGSSTLLKEERFRKQMQSTFASKLEALANLLHSWKSEERESFDSCLLSEEVRSLLEKPQKTESLVEERTEFMHLRTVKSKTTGKRPVEGSQAISRTDGVTLSRSALSPSRLRSAATPRHSQKEVTGTSRKRYLTATEASRRFTRSTSKESVENQPLQSPSKRKSGDVLDDQAKPRKARRVGDDSTALMPTGQLPNNTLPTKHRPSNSMLLPFGHVLSQVKENSEH